MKYVSVRVIYPRAPCLCMVGMKINLLFYVPAKPLTDIFLHVFQTATLVDGATTKVHLSTAAFTDSIKMVSPALRMHCNVSISIY